VAAVPIASQTKLKKIVAGFPPRRPGFKPLSGHVEFCDGQKWHRGRFSSRTSVSPANLHSICFSIVMFITPEAGTIGQEWPQCQKPHKPNKKNAWVRFQLTRSLTVRNRFKFVLFNKTVSTACAVWRRIIARFIWYKWEIAWKKRIAAHLRYYPR
jgi:hypothetical protein